MKRGLKVEISESNLATENHLRGSRTAPWIKIRILSGPILLKNEPPTRFVPVTQRVAPPVPADGGETHAPADFLSTTANSGGMIISMIDSLIGRYSSTRGFPRRPRHLESDWLQALGSTALPESGQSSRFNCTTLTDRSGNRQVGGPPGSRSFFSGSKMFGRLRLTYSRG